MNDTDVIRRLYLEGNSTRQVAAITGISKSKVGKIVAELGISRSQSDSQINGCAKTTRIAPDWSFLPLNPSKSWILGLIYGDGSLSSKGYRIEITSGDDDIVRKVNRQFGGNLYIACRPTYKVVQINSKRIWMELNTNFNLIPNKANQGLIFPSFSEDKNIPHFVRGLLDSDGSWYLDTRSKRPLLKFSYVSKDEKFVSELRRHIVNYVQVSRNRQGRPNGNNAYEITFSNKDAIAIGHWIYNASVEANRGHRKYAIWKSFA